MESACETCAYFRAGTQFLPILTRQRDHARADPDQRLIRLQSKFVRTAHRYRTIQIQARPHTITRHRACKEAAASEEE